MSSLDIDYFPKDIIIYKPQVGEDVEKLKDLKRFIMLKGFHPDIHNDKILDRTVIKSRAASIIPADTERFNNLIFQLENCLIHYDLKDYAFDFIAAPSSCNYFTPVLAYLFDKPLIYIQWMEPRLFVKDQFKDKRCLMFTNSFQDFQAEYRLHTAITKSGANVIAIVGIMNRTDIGDMGMLRKVRKIALMECPGNTFVPPPT